MNRHGRGTSRMSFITRGSRIDTQPIPMPSARAASHIMVIAATAVSDLGGGVGEYRELTRRLVETGKLEAGVTGGERPRIGSQRIGVAALELVEHTLPARRLVD